MKTAHIAVRKMGMPKKRLVTIASTRSEAEVARRSSQVTASPTVSLIHW